LRKGEDKPTQTVPRQESGGGDMGGALLEKMTGEREILSLLMLEILFRQANLENLFRRNIRDHLQGRREDFLERIMEEKRKMG
jgi:hypothetical protein